MADFPAVMRDLGGDLGGRIGVTTLITSLACIVSCFVASLVAYKICEPYVIPEEEQRWLIITVSSAMIALLSAMVVEHTYVIYYVRTVFSRRIPHDIRLDRVFFCILACYWIFFGVGQLFFAIALVHIWHRSASPKLLLGASFTLVPVIVSTGLLHIKATIIRHALTIVVRLMRLPQAVVESRTSDNCIICLETLVIGDRLIRLPCLHQYHRKCAVDWLLKNQTCPQCRLPI